uniref:Uncharacterized protein n=1 Tax=Avena sativa TaxID=4498 RepID=A0ACD5TMT9_AVESA
MSHPREEGDSSASPPPDTAPPTEDENLLPEVLLRLPARPSSLPRASLVCKRWRNLVGDPQFLRRFCAHHREAPIIGVFLEFYRRELSFRSILDPPDQIPSQRFSLRLDGTEGGGIWTFRGSRHGRVVLTSGDHLGRGSRQVLVWDPVTGERRFISGPPPQLDHDWGKYHVQADVICVAGDEGHVHGACHSNPFKVALVCAGKRIARSCVYSSETDSWGDTIATEVQYNIMSLGSRSILVGNSLYWFIFGTRTGILELDLDTQIPAVVQVPEDAHRGHRGLYLSTLGGGLGFIAMSDNYVAQLWLRTTDFDGATGWMPGQAIELGKLLPLRSGEWTNFQTVMGVAGDDNVIFVSTNRGVFMVYLETMQFKKIFERNPFANCTTSTIHPFISFCAAGSSTPQY